ncbi:MAG: SUMF1/EgtB/PvdO family nonheme iron enzyme, partial [Planctomycetota bacterium]|nr:SUMF1/EgtB/PvdO family nonheme iron enzyme [Planctomycetota bacterium]
SQPMIGLHWRDAKDWVSRAGSGFRLPLEKEWEYACRAGTKAHFFWGDDIKNAQANIERIKVSAEAPESLEDTDASENRVNGFGLVHIIGNASEWVEETLYIYNDARLLDPKDVGAHIVRGGSVLSAFAAGRSRARRQTYGKSGLRRLATGFRVAVSLPEDFLKD